MLVDFEPYDLKTVTLLEMARLYLKPELKLKFLEKQLLKKMLSFKEKENEGRLLHQSLPS